MATEVEEHLYVLCLLCDPFKVFGEEDGQHCLSLARTPRYPEQVRIAVQPGLVDTVLSNPFASANDPHSFCAYKPLSVDIGISEEERVSTLGDLMFEGFY